MPALDGGSDVLHPVGVCKAVDAGGPGNLQASRPAITRSLAASSSMSTELAAEAREIDESAITLFAKSGEKR